MILSKWLRWLAEKSDAFHRKTFEKSLGASFLRRFYGLQRTRPDLAEGERITAALHELLDSRYPNWTKDEKTAVLNRHASCSSLIDFLYDYEMKTYGRTVYGRTDDTFRGSL